MDFIKDITKSLKGFPYNRPKYLQNNRMAYFNGFLLQYSGDQDDKTWLYEHQHMPATGGKSYLIVLDDVRELAISDEYK